MSQQHNPMAPDAAQVVAWERPGATGIDITIRKTRPTDHYPMARCRRRCPKTAQPAVAAAAAPGALDRQHQIAGRAGRQQKAEPQQDGDAGSVSRDSRAQ